MMKIDSAYMSIFIVDIQLKVYLPTFRQAGTLVIECRSPICMVQKTCLTETKRRKWSGRNQRIEQTISF